MQLQERACKVPAHIERTRLVPSLRIMPAAQSAAFIWAQAQIHVSHPRCIALLDSQTLAPFLPRSP